MNDPQLDARFRQRITFVLAFTLLGLSSGSLWATPKGLHSPSRQDAQPTENRERNRPADQVRFNQDIRPILSDRCFLCHGPDQTGPQAKETDLRLDIRDQAIDHGVFDFDSPDDSEILTRVRSTGDDQMPPADSHKASLSEAESELLKRWIEQGALYERHWAYVVPKRPDVPADIRDPRPGHNAIDALVVSKLDQHGLQPSPIAKREALIRRATLDLTGVPPTPEEYEAFLNDSRTDLEAYERLIDHLLASPKFGEHRARYWLDASRYADTSGYQYDFERTQWVWRDWVIHAFNSNQPFDEFILHQVAGDLIPNATPQTRLATGFNRNHPITIEGGVVDEEYRTEYVIDRVVTTSTVFLGQTFLCARCHDHKYDPLTQRDFYQFYAFFNNVPEKGLNGFAPQENIASPLGTERRVQLEHRLQDLQAEILKLDRPFARWAETLQARTTHRWQVPKDVTVHSTGGATHEDLPDGSILFSGKNATTDDYTLSFSTNVRTVRSLQLTALTDASFNGRTGRAANGNFVLTEFRVETQGPLVEARAAFQPAKIVSATADYQQPGYPISAAIDGKLGRTGWAVDGNTKHENRSAIFTLEKPIPPGSKIRVTLQQRFGTSHQIGRVKLACSSLAQTRPRFAELQRIPTDSRTRQQESHWRSILLSEFGSAADKRWANEMSVLEKEIARVSTFPKTMIMKERATPRQAFVLQRGEYDQPLKDQPLSPSIPEALGDFSQYPRNRLGLARWLVSDEQPLTARVTVNRFWQQLFGIGLVKTSEDFGSQGEYPSNRELLDWLATEFQASGWDVKRLFKTVMMSATYRQESRVTPEQLALDPDNRWLSRGPRIRMDGEMIRDSALAAAGLLDSSLGGPSVYPYHPEGLWLEINNRPNFSKAYPHSSLPRDLYRRTMYTFWKRSVPPPSIATFDAPSREYCVVRRSRTNTPLQAFVLMHDPQFVEAARVLAQSMLLAQLRNEDSSFAPSAANQHRGKLNLEEFRSPLNDLFVRCLSRLASDQEASVMYREYERLHASFAKQPDAVTRLITIGEAPLAQKLDRHSLAVWTQLTRTIMNLSEFVTKE